MAKIFLKCGLLIRRKNSSEIYGIFLMPILKGGKSGDFWFSLKFENPWSPSKLVKEIPFVLPSTPTVYDQRGLSARKPSRKENVSKISMNK